MQRMTGKEMQRIFETMKEGNTGMKGSDGPTAVFVAGRKSGKVSLKQRIRRYVYGIRTAQVERRLKVGAHTLNQVCGYLVNELGYRELEKDHPDYQEEYEEMRASMILQYKPELLEDPAAMEDLTAHTQEAVNEYLERMKLRRESAKKIPAEVFDIDFHKFVKEEGGNESHFMVETTHHYIGGGASGNTGTVKKYQREFKQVYRYYGVTQEDMDNKTERYKEVVRMLVSHGS